MKHYYLILMSIFVFTFSVKAQFQLKQSTLPSIGESYITVSADTGTFDFKSTGTNHTWDFSALNINGGTNTQDYIAPSSTPHAGAFASSNIATKDVAGNYGFYSFSSSAYEMDGVTTPASVIAYTTPLKMFDLPFSYGSATNSNTSATYTSGVVFNRTVTWAATGDGHGTLKLPSGIYSNVLRIKGVQNVTDQSSFGNLYTEITSYYWYGTETKDPLFAVHYMISWGMVSQYLVWVNVNGKLVGQEELNKQGLAFDFYPNPVEQKTIVRYALENSSDVNIAVLNMMGQKVKQINLENQQPGKYQQELYADKLAAGVYLIQIEANGAVSQQKMLVN